MAKRQRRPRWLTQRLINENIGTIETNIIRLVGEQAAAAGMPLQVYVLTRYLPKLERLGETRNGLAWTRRLFGITDGGRAGELLKTFQSNGGRPSKTSRGAPTGFSQRQAAEKAGMSKRQEVNAVGCALPVRRKEA